MTDTGKPTAPQTSEDAERPDAYGKKAVLGAAVGYAMDGFDLLIIGFALTAITATFGLSDTQAGSLSTVTLVGAVLGGVVFGIMSDYFGRVRVLTWSIVLFGVLIFHERLRTTQWAAVCLGAAAVAVLSIFCMFAGPVNSQTPAYRAPRTADGKPDLNGIWQAMNTANWDIQGHTAAAGPIPALGAAFFVPAGTGIVEGEEIPYTPAAAATRASGRRRSTSALGV